MTKQEFATWSMGMKHFFPRDNVLPNEAAMQLWYSALSDLDYRTAEAFLLKWVTTQKWPPTIAEIRGGCVEMLEDAPPDWGEAWEELCKAISRYGYMQEEKALSHLRPLTRACAERLGWQSLCTSENQTADRANFRQVYETISKRATEDRQIPMKLKATIENLKLGGSNGPLLPKQV